MTLPTSLSVTINSSTSLISPPLSHPSRYTSLRQSPHSVTQQSCTEPMTTQCPCLFTSLLKRDESQCFNHGIVSIDILGHLDLLLARFVLASDNPQLIYDFTSYANIIVFWLCFPQSSLIPVAVFLSRTCLGYTLKLPTQNIGCNSALTFVR